MSDIDCKKECEVEFLDDIAGLDSTIKTRFCNEMCEIMTTCLPNTVGLSELQRQEITRKVWLKASRDLLALTKGDPAALSPQYVDKTYATFRAVKYYRLANLIYYDTELKEEFLANGIDTKEIARLISETAKTRTKVDIHPAAEIGEEFVIDHGVDTVIGETCKIGDRCNILHAVNLGALESNNGVSGKRHPTLGNDVKIAGFVRIFGPVTIEDDVEICNKCVIIENVPAKTKVSIVNQLQLSRPTDPKLKAKDIKVEVYGVVPDADGHFSIYGCSFNEPKVSLVNEDYEKIQGLKVQILEYSSRKLTCLLIIGKDFDKEKNKLDDINLMIENTGSKIYLTSSLGFRRTFEQIYR